MSLVGSIQKVKHQIFYKYDQRVGLQLQTISLRPRLSAKHLLKDYYLSIGPNKTKISFVEDVYGNQTARCLVQDTADRLEIESTSVISFLSDNPFDFFLCDDAQYIPFVYDEKRRTALAPYLAPIMTHVDTSEWFEGLSSKSLPSINALVQLNTRVAKTIKYKEREEEGVQSPDETLVRRSGSCRDIAWLIISLLRQLGLASRFVSGYLIQHNTDEANSIGTNKVDFHAWAEVFVPGAGWIGLDGTSGMICADQHVSLCAAPHFQHTGPVRGQIGYTKATLDFKLQIEIGDTIY